MLLIYVSHSIKTPDRRCEFAMTCSLKWNFLLQSFVLVFMSRGFQVVSWVVWDPRSAFRVQLRDNRQKPDSSHSQGAFVEVPEGLYFSNQP